MSIDLFTTPAAFMTTASATPVLFAAGVCPRPVENTAMDNAIVARLDSGKQQSHPPRGIPR